jgi:hypothetical protein
VRDLLLWAKHLFVEAVVALAPNRAVKDEQRALLHPRILNRAWLQSRWRKGAECSAAVHALLAAEGACARRPASPSGAARRTEHHDHHL